MPGGGGPRIAVPPPVPHALAGDPQARIVDLSGQTMGTVWRVRVAAPAAFDPASLTVAIAARLGMLVAEMSHWEPASLLSRFNRAKAGQWLSLPPDFATVIATGLDIAARSDGAFDPALGALVDLWGFGPVAAAAPPDAAAVDAALGVSGWRRLEYDPAARRLRQPGGLRLDLSGIAKGHAVDAVADLLRERGFAHALVEIGGELAGRGVRPDREPWWVDLETPGRPMQVPDLPPFRVALHELAVATSGTYVRGDHNLESSTGCPARHNVVSASVLHRSAMYADAWASALTVLGLEAGLALAASEDLAARIVVRDADGVREIVSPALMEML